MGASDGRERARVSGKCPACGSGGLFVGSGGYLTCPWAECPNPGAPHDALVKAPEPPADGYVSRNVYDYDEPEPPADVREALTWGDRDLTAKWGQASEAARKSEHHFPADCLAEAVEVYNFLCDRLNEARTPAPHVVTTVEELEALPVGAIVKSSAGTVACRHSEFFGVVFGDERPFRWDLLALPVTVLTPAPAPIDHAAQMQFMAEVMAERATHEARGYGTEHDKAHGGIPHLLYWAMEYAAKGEHVKAMSLVRAAQDILSAPIDRGALVEKVARIIMLDHPNEECGSCGYYHPAPEDFDRCEVDREHAKGTARKVLDAIEEVHCG